MFSKRHTNRLLKIAYVPLSMGAQQAMGGMPPAGPEGQPPMDPAMMQGGGMPPMGPEGMPPQGGEMPPMDPSMSGMGPVDPETGMIIIDPAQGIVMDPNTGIMLNKQTGEFMTQDGQPIPPEQAMQMIEEAAAQMGGMPPAGPEGDQPPMDPAMAGDPSMGGMPPAGPEGQPPMDPAMMQGGGMPPQGGEMPPMDPSMGGMPPQEPIPGPDGSINGTFPPVPADQLPGAAPAAPAGEEGDIDSMLPGFSDFMSRTEQQANKQGKINQRVIKELSGVRGDLQGVMRELSQFTDNQDTLLARLTDLANRLERHMAATTGIPVDRGM